MNKELVLGFADKIMLSDDLDQYQVSFGDERDQYFKRYTFETGDSVMIYYPENITEDTQITTYYPGGGFTTDWYSQRNGRRVAGIQDYLIANGSDQIVVMPDSVQSVGRREYIGVKMTEYLTNEYNLNNTSSSWAGFSYGATPTLSAATTYMDLNPDCDPQIVVEIDGYNSYKERPGYVASGIADSFKNTDSILISIDPSGKAASNYLDYYAKEGINVVKAVTVKSDGLLEVNYGDGIEIQKNGDNHLRIRQNYFNDGFFEFNGNSSTTLPSEGYEYYVWDSSTEDWVQIDVSQIDTYEKMVNYFGGEVSLTSNTSNLLQLADLVLKSDDKVLESYLNGIRAVIRGTGLVSGGSAGGFSSTTKMPSAVPGVVSKYCSSVVSSLTKLAKETEQFARIGESIEEMNSNLENEALAIDDSAVGEEELLEDDFSISINDEISGVTAGTTAIVTGGISSAILAIDDEEDEEQNNFDDDIYIDDENEMIVEEEKTNSYTTKGNTSSNSYSGTSSSSGSSSSSSSYSSSSSNSSTNTTDIVTKVEPADALDDFYKYDQVVSSDNRFVFEHVDGYKLVIHNNGNVINGVEHYYDFGTSDNAVNMLSNIKPMYQGNQYFQGIIQDGQYVKVIFNNNVYNGFSLDTVERLYSSLKGYTKV